ncbi:oxidoreductase [Planctomycetaceae bacterium SCGC AG-212-F19]|nr:oxidoreductase [Planctomycetaceae bacterium SCGC AG-212-F19]
MLRVGIVGCGRILNAHLQGFQQLRAKGIDDFRITALVARHEPDAWMFHTRGQGPPPRPPVLPPESGDPLGAPHTYVSDFQIDVPVHVFTDYRQMIDQRTVDAVLDLTPVFLHHPIALTALDVGLHVLTQKPLAVTVRAAQAMVARAHDKKLTLGTFENARYRPLIRATRWAFETGLLGTPQMAVLGSVGGLWSPDRIVAQTPWRHVKHLAGGGGSIDIGVHQMDVVRYVMGEVAGVQALVRTFEPERFLREGNAITQRVKAEVDDTYFAGLTFVNGAVGQLLWSWAGHGAPLPIPDAPGFYGSRGCVLGGALITDAGREPIIERFESDLDAERRQRLYPLGLTDPYAILTWQWLESIRTGKGMEKDGADGLRDLAAAYAILESGVARRMVSLDEVLTGAVDTYQRDIDAHYGLI